MTSRASALSTTSTTRTSRTSRRCQTTEQAARTCWPRQKTRLRDAVSAARWSSARGLVVQDLPPATAWLPDRQALDAEALTVLLRRDDTRRRPVTAPKRRRGRTRRRNG